MSEEWESDEPPLESDNHRDQLDLLLNCLRWWWRDRRDCYASANTTIYYSPDRSPKRDFRGPDLFVVLGVDPRPRRSWMVWREGYRYPNVIIEILSDSTARIDRNQKRELYQNTFKTPEYFWFDPETGDEFVGLWLVDGRYQPIPADERGWLWSEQLGLYLGIQSGQLRLFTPVGDLILTGDERANQEQQRAERLAEEIAQLRQRLRDLGIDPEP